ncbi:MAG: hypothetical protein MUD13_09355, partial [Candidatus Nanopelagicales bacterium]|nr:hypothetical protein [Candidatus Nanopelagicales bacterium]
MGLGAGAGRQEGDGGGAGRRQACGGEALTRPCHDAVDPTRAVPDRDLVLAPGQGPRALDLGLFGDRRLVPPTRGALIAGQAAAQGVDAVVPLLA